MVLPLKPLSLRPMLNSRTANSDRQTGGLQTVVLGILITIIMLSSCAVRKSIEVYFLGSVNTEFSTAHGSKKIRATVGNVHLTNPQLCSDLERTAPEAVDFQARKGQITMLPQVLILPGSISPALPAHYYHRSLSTAFAKASFAFSDAPIYLKNRLLLI